MVPQADLVLRVMQKLLTIVVLSLVGGCSSDDAEPCSLAHRKGTYIQHMEERANGSCGLAPDQVVRVDNPAGLGGDCALDAPDQLSDDKCEFSRSYTCTTDLGTASVVAVVTEHDGGDKMSGIFSITQRNTAGEFICASTYDVTFARQ